MQGNDAPPAAPRPSSTTFLHVTWDAPLVVGNTLSCSTGGWPTPPQVTYSFVNSANGQVLQTGAKATFLLHAIRSRGDDLLRDRGVERRRDDAGGDTADDRRARAAEGVAEAGRPAHRSTRRRPHRERHASQPARAVRQGAGLRHAPAPGRREALPLGGERERFGWDVSVPVQLPSCARPRLTWPLTSPSPRPTAFRA